MSRKIIIAVFCFVVLFVCYRIEQKVYFNRSYSNYKQQKNSYEQDEVITWKELSDQENLKKRAIKENENVGPKTAYLSFDDGPSDITNQILDILAEHNIKATFFLVGNEITEDMESVIKSMVEQGHTLGIHTYSHKKNEIYRSVDSYIEDVEKTYQRIYEVTGVGTNIYRFPWGSVNCYIDDFCDDIIEEMERRGFTYFDWNVSAEDSVGKPSEYSILHNVEKDLTKYYEPVILMHDSKINHLTVKVLPQIIKEIEEKGYKFGTLDNRSTPCQYRR